MELVLFMMKNAFFRTLIHILPAIILMAAPSYIHALSPDHYAASSVMSTGKWTRVKVSVAGMHIISDSELRRLGFTDPSKVHVYGLGGRRPGEGLHASTPFDLPLLPSVRTDKGIVFFATDHFSWTKGTTETRPFIHTIHPYSDESYYFLSDAPTDEFSLEDALTSPTVTGTPLNRFTERIVHEKELEPAGESGSQVFGEDFRTQRSQTFNFKLPGRVNGTDAYAFIRFAAKTTNGSSSLTFKANGKQLESSASDRISGVSHSYFCAATETRKTITDQGESLDLGIDYSQTGVLFKARLDYIETFYTRHLALSGGELYFYGSYGTGDALEVTGCSPSTIIWDVTDPIRPRKVSYSLEGDKARFSITSGGYREFVAFNPDAVTRSAVSEGAVANQNIHGLETPDLIVITLPQYREGAEKIAAMHASRDGFRTAVINAQEIYNEFSGGKSDPGAFRRMLKMFYDRGDDNGHALRYCLLMGKPSYDNKMVSSIVKNAGYTPLPIYQSYDGYSSEASYSTDDYIAMLEDAEDSRFIISTAPISIAVGRLPVTSGAQALQMAAKIERYANEAELGTWRNKVMLIADDEDSGAHLNQAEAAYLAAQTNGNGSSFIFDRLYLDSYRRVQTGTGDTYPQATERMLRNYNDGVLFTGYIGHASETSWGHEKLWQWPSISSMTNKNLTFIYAATCDFAFWDAPEYCGAEVLVLNPDAGAVGVIAASRKVYVASNGPFSKSMFTYLFQYDEEGQALRFGDAYLKTRNAQRNSNSLRYLFMGDPALRIPNPSHKVNIASIDGIETSSLSDDNLPELKAKSSVKVEGDIRRPDGSIADDFNGTVNLQLYDGERVITTYGQGSTGVVISYNDRDRRLAMTTAKVAAGRWSADLRVPPEIQGIYTKAMISGYAWSDGRLEANGMTTDLYVYGYDGSAGSDTTGPVIEYFYANTPNFESGDLVNSNPVIMARLSDESGINISDTGIGHSLTLTVDDSTVFSDLSSYFTVDSESPGAGTLAYPLNGIKAGKHTLTLTAWDNANNVSKATIDINVGAAVDPVIYGITASTNDTQADFRIELDRPNTKLNCEIGIFDLSGRRVWSLEDTLNSDMHSNITTSWDLRDSGGRRVDRGIYIYRVTVETPEGTYSSKSKKIAIS